MFRFDCASCNRSFFTYETKDALKLSVCPYCRSYRINTTGNIAKLFSTDELEDVIESKKENRVFNEIIEVEKIIPKRGRPKKNGIK